MIYAGVAIWSLATAACGAFQACSLTALNLVTPNNLRGTGVAVFNTIAAMLGGSLGPVLIAAASQFGGTAAIGVGLAVMIGVCCPLGALFLLLGLRSMRAAMAAVEAPLSPDTGTRSIS